MGVGHTHVRRAAETLAHAVSHAAAGSDSVTLTQAQITGLAAALAALEPLITTLPVSKGGTGNSTAQTAGRLWFAAATGILASDAALAWDAVNKWLLFGPTGPATAPVDITRGVGLAALLRLRGNAQTTAAGQVYLDVYADGTGYGLQGYGAGGLSLGTNGVVRQVITSAGSFGFNRAIPLFVMHNSTSFAKTDTAVRDTWFMSSNEVGGGFPFGALFSITGAAALANRIFSLGTTDYNSAWGGSLVLQRYGGTVGIGTGATGVATAPLQVVGAVHLDTSVRVGTSGTAITQTRVYTPTLTPSLIAGIGLAEQTFTVTGLATTDTITLNGPAPAAGTAPVAWRVSAANTLAISFQTTAISLTPSSGTYRVIAFRS